MSLMPRFLQECEYYCYTHQCLLLWYNKKQPQTLKSVRVLVLFAIDKEKHEEEKVVGAQTAVP